MSLSQLIFYSVGKNHEMDFICDHILRVENQAGEKNGQQVCRTVTLVESPSLAVGEK